MVRESPRLTIIGKREAILDGQAISYIIKRSPKAKYVRLEVGSEMGLTVVIPRSYKCDRIPYLLREKRRWISGKLAKYGQVRLLTAEKEVTSGDTIPYLGRDLEVVIAHNHIVSDCIKLEDRKLVVSLGSTGNGRLNLMLERWYRLQAAKLINQMTERLSAELGLTYNRLTIRGQKSRWGSCSRKGNLSFNWRLLMVPTPVISYVIIHELAHLREMNHTKKFWKLVAHHCPRWRVQRKWLKDHQTELAARLSV